MMKESIKNTDFQSIPVDTALVAEVAAARETSSKLQMRCRWTKTVASGGMKLGSLLTQSTTCPFRPGKLAHNCLREIILVFAPGDCI